MVTAGAASIYSTPRDMARYVAALLGGGANEHGSVLKPATLADACSSPTTSPIPGCRVSGWRSSGSISAGISRSSTEGSSPASTRRSSLAPDDGVGVMAFTNGARRAMLWLPGEVARPAQAAARRPGRGDPHRRPAAPRDLGRPLRLVPAVRPGSPMCGRRIDDRRRGRGLRPRRPAHGSSAEPDTRAVQGLSAAPRRRGRPVRLPDRPLRVRDRHGAGRVQPRPRRGDDGESTST